MKKVLVFVAIVVCGWVVSAQSSRRAATRGQQNSSDNSGSSGPSGSFSGLMLDTNLYYGKSKAVAKPTMLTSDPTQSNEFDTTSTLYAVKFGLISSGGWYVGGMYSDRADASGSGTVHGQGVGAGVGFFGNGGLSLRAFYKFSESYGDYNKGEGFNGEISYLIKFSARTYFGFLISHQEVTYQSNPTIALYRPWTSTWTHPAITLAYLMR